MRGSRRERLLLTVVHEIVGAGRWRIVGVSAALFFHMAMSRLGVGREQWRQMLCDLVGGHVVSLVWRTDGGIHRFRLVVCKGEAYDKA